MLKVICGKCWNEAFLSLVVKLLIYLFTHLLVGQQGAFKLTFEVMKTIIEPGYEKRNVSCIKIISSREFLMTQQKNKEREIFFYSKEQKVFACCCARIRRCKYCGVLEVSALGFETS